ncbi:MAG TPA: O-antigen ligase family protein [Nitrospirae bacterium]|nr:O-antigen ligase family protein [Nitrospirota bacterium]
MNSIRKLNISGVTRALLYVLIFFQPFNHFNSFREISFYALLAVFLVRIFKGEIKNIAFSDKTIIALSMLVGWSLFVSLAGPFYADSLNAIRKNLLKEVVIFLVIIAEFKSVRDLKPLFWIVVSSFAALTAASLVENVIKDPETFYSLLPAVSWRSVSTYFYAGYANKTTFYLPFIAAWLISINELSYKKRIGTITLFAGSVLCYIYDARTALLAITIAFFVILLLSKKYKIVIVFIIAAILCVSIMVNSKDDRFTRYTSLIKAETYITDEWSGLNGRLGIWQVTLSVIKERPLIGYGYGWKKIAWVLKEMIDADDKFWDGTFPSAYRYFVEGTKLSYGRVNPHNLLLQIVFEIGLVGLVLFLWLWSTLIMKIVNTIKSAGTTEAKNFMLCSFGLLLSYILINLTNGFWQESYGMMMFLFMALIFVIHREAEITTEEH